MAHAAPAPHHRPLRWLATLWLTASALACGAVDFLPPPPPNPPALPKPVVAEAAVADAAVEEAPEPPVLLVPASLPADGTAPQVSVLSPRSGQILATSGADAVAVKVDLRGGTGGVALMLDGWPARVFHSTKEAVALGDLSAGPLGEGHHVLVAAALRPSGATFKAKGARVAVSFYVGKKTPGAEQAKKPALFLVRPDTTLEGASATHVLVDVLVMPPSDKPPRVALALDGPGLDAPLRVAGGEDVAYTMENLRAGTYTLTGELLADNGKALEATRVTRAVVVHPALSTRADAGRDADAASATGTATPHAKPKSP